MNLSGIKRKSIPKFPFFSGEYRGAMRDVAGEVGCPSTASRKAVPLAEAIF